MVVKPLDMLPSNTVGYQNVWGTIMNTAILKFEQKHEYIRTCIEEFLSNFKSRRWSHNGPGLITRVYYSNAEQWKSMNLHTVKRYVFQYSPYQFIGRKCYQDASDARVDITRCTFEQSPKKSDGEWEYLWMPPSYFLSIKDILLDGSLPTFIRGFTKWQSSNTLRGQQHDSITVGLSTDGERLSLVICRLGKNDMAETNRRDTWVLHGSRST